jgi:Secretion system C-terminal sorting domain
MKYVLILCLMVVLTVSSVFAVNTNPVVTGPATADDGNQTVNISGTLPGFVPQLNELDEIIGDTLFIGTSGWDQPHNGGTSRQIGYTDGDPYNVYIVFTKLFGLIPSNERHVMYTTITDDGEGGFDVDPSPAGAMEFGYRSGYTTLAYNVGTSTGYGTFHYSPASGDPWSSVAVIENPFVPGLFNQGTVPNPFVLERIWPHSVYGNTNHVHMLMHEAREGNSDMMEITYYRFEPNEVNGLMNPAHDGDPHVISDVAMNIAADISVNATGERVASGVVVNRLGTIGEDFAGEGEDEQWNNDVYIYESLDAGVTWEDPIDVSQFIAPNYNALPDTTAANGDTMRAYTDCSVIYDDEDNLHVAFTAPLFDFFREVSYFESRIYHWMLDDMGEDVWTMINYAPFAGGPETWARQTDRPSLYFDNDTGILWCAMEQAGWGPDTTDWSAASGLTNSEVYITASPPGAYNGLLWTTPVNVTNTKYTVDGNGAPVGESRAETDVNIALRSEGDFLHMFYLLDLDAGTGIASTPEGEATDNPIVYHRIAKQDLLDVFEANGEWLQNYPMHNDSTGFWQDEVDYNWADYGGFFTENRFIDSVGDDNPLSPSEFELKQNYPNPFNPSTQIAFSIGRPADVKLAVYDILGREIAVLVNRSMSAGSHSINFMADDLPSGVYFYKMEAGGNEQVRKMVLMK